MSIFLTCRMRQSQNAEETAYTSFAHLLTVFALPVSVGSAPARAHRGLSLSHAENLAHRVAVFAASGKPSRAKNPPPGAPGWLAAAAGRKVVFFDDRILPVVRHRMEIQVEGRTLQ